MLQKPEKPAGTILLLVKHIGFDTTSYMKDKSSVGVELLRKDEGFMRIRVMVHEHRFGTDLWPFQTKSNEELIEDDHLPFIAEELEIPYNPGKEEKLSVVSFDIDQQFQEVSLAAIENKYINEMSKNALLRGSSAKR